MPRILLTAEEKKERITSSRIKWRSENRERYNKCMVPIAKRYYDTNKAVESKKSLARYHFKREAERFRNILIDA